MPRDPQNRTEWQEAADAAHACLSIAAACAYGLVEGGPDVDEERCRDILARAFQEHRIRPAPDAIARLVAARTEQLV